MEEITAKIYENFILYINLTLYFKRDVLIFTSNNLLFTEATFIEELEMFIERATLYPARPKTEPENNSQIL